MDENHQQAMFLNTAELICLLQTAEVPHLVDFFIQSSESKPSDRHLARAHQNLVQRNILTRTGKISSEYQGSLAPLFYPDTMLMSVRIRPVTGQESISFLQKSGAVLLYYFVPAKDLHCIEQVHSVTQIEKLITDWYELQKYVPVTARCSLSMEVLEQTRSFAQNGEVQSAVGALYKADCDQQEKEQIVQALRKPSLSGSLAVMEFRGDTALDAYSLALMAHNQTIWHIFQPDSEQEQLVIDGNVQSLDRLLDKIIQRFLGDNMLDEPLNNKNVVTFTLSIDELAYCLHAINAPTVAASLLKAAYPEASEQEVMTYLQDAGNGLLARGWCKPAETGLPVPVVRLEAAVFPLARYDYVVQAEITRPDLHSIANINVLKDRSFTAVLHPDTSLYVLEHGHIKALPAYVSKLFLDFGEGARSTKGTTHKINYALVSTAIEASAEKQMDDLIKAGFSKLEAKQFAADLSNTSYRGSIIRVNVGAQSTPQIAQKVPEPVLLLLRGPENSWLFEFSSANDDLGSVSLVDRVAFEKILTAFLN